MSVPYNEAAGNSIPSDPGSAIPRYHELRAFCCRFVGWSAERAAAVENVMHTLLTASARRAPVALQGESDLVPVAYALHRRLVGYDLPFVVCDPRRREGDGSVRSLPNRRTGLLALDAAMGGSVCLRSHRVPRDFEALASACREASSATMLFICLSTSDPMRDLLCSPIRIPSLAERAPDLEHLLDESLKDAAETLGVHDGRLSESLRESVLRHVESFPDLEKTALRLLALASSRNVSQAAERLHMAPVSLSRWVSRRRWISGLFET
jgi:hypothetical protein